MIVRTAPIQAPDPDAIRAMERLESQLRRAADDLAESLAVMRAATPGYSPDGRQRCLRWMAVAQDHCARFAGHKSYCRTRATLDREASDKYASRS